jgi:hypothetical protein
MKTSFILIWLMLVICNIEALYYIDFKSDIFLQVYIVISIMLLQIQSFIVFFTNNVVSDSLHKKILNLMYIGYLYHIIGFIIASGCSNMLCSYLFINGLFQLVFGCVLPKVILTESGLAELQNRNITRTVNNPIDILTIPLISSTFNSTEHTELTCSICTEDYIVDEAITILVCKHYYHSPCINKWITVSATCPNCRAELIV